MMTEKNILVFVAIVLAGVCVGFWSDATFHNPPKGMWLFLAAVLLGIGYLINTSK